MSPKNKPSASREHTLGEVASQYLINLTPDNRLKAQPEVTKFVRWFGENRSVNNLTAQEIENYTERLTSTITELQEKIEPVKEFLAFAHKKGFIKARLGQHLKIKKTPTKIPVIRKSQEQKAAQLTPEGYAALEAEIKSLVAERPKIVDEIRKAAADKDFRENAPLEAAKEYQGKVESRIKELESVLKSATLINEKQNSGHGAIIGDIVILLDLSSKERIQYTLVDMKEANPSAGKISVNSPIGKALIGHKPGDRIEVNAPAGMMPYLIEELKQS